MKASKCKLFFLKTIKKYNKFDSVKLIVNEIEINIVEVKKEKINKEIHEFHCIRTYGNNEILKCKNKNTNLELIYSFEGSSYNYYFIHNINNNCLIIKADAFLENYYDYFCIKTIDVVQYYKIIKKEKNENKRCD